MCSSDLEAPEWSGCDTFFWDGSGSGPTMGHRAAVSWWEVRHGPAGVQLREFDDMGAAVGFVADVVEAAVGVGHPAVAAVHAAAGRCPDADAIVRLVNLSAVGVFVEGIGGGS